jgi:hypothetical protein
VLGPIAEAAAVALVLQELLPALLRLQHPAYAVAAIRSRAWIPVLSSTHKVWVSCW